MKVIVAGMSKTGTKTMVTALQELGFNVYDYLEHYLYLGDDWTNICITGGTVEDFQRMYRNVDAAVDLPSWYFWEDLHKAFPEAKIILTVRDNEDDWIKSIKTQHETMNNSMMLMMRYLSITFRRFYGYGQLVGATAFGITNRSWFKQDPLNELLLRKVYRRHNTYVLETAPKDKLLLYNVKQGWEPLCNFLKVDIPLKPFPHKNIRGSITQELMAANPFFIKMQKELKISLSVLSLLFLFGCYKVFKFTKARFIFSSPKPSSVGIQSTLSSYVASSVDYIKFWK